MATTIMATRQVVEDYQRLFVNRRAYTMQSMRPHPETGRHYYFRPSKKGTDIPLMLTEGTIRQHLEGIVAPADLQGARDGDWVIARITRHAGSASAAQAVVVKRLDPERPVELATESAIARFDLPQEFPAAALREAAAFGEHVDPREAARRQDLRDLPLVTIDGEDARDFDDAVYAEPHRAAIA